jgi:Cu-Zn family superoxide dismutase
MRHTILPLSVLALGLAACGSSEPAEQSADQTAMDTLPVAEARQAEAVLATADGTQAGRVIATASEGGVMIALNVEGLAPGEHGAHVHMTGSCEPPAFGSAGGHWNPADAQHGLENPAGPHAGDMPNVAVGSDGTGTLGYTLQGGTFDSLLDADGAAFVVHAKPDDQTTDPSGNSGDRIACGVFSEN